MVMNTERLRVALWGASGNMGRRYTAVLNALGDSIIPIDVHQSETERLALSAGADCILVATPTETHETILKQLAQLHIPVLCEKPICKDLKALEAILKLYYQNRTGFRMINQYASMVPQPPNQGPTYYDYFNHGKDGLAWDCVNILGLAGGEVALAEKSYYWRVCINGDVLSHSNVDFSYFDMLKKYRREMNRSMDDYIMRAHERAAEFERANNA